MSDDLLQEVQALKDALLALQGRLRDLERQLERRPQAPPQAIGGRSAAASVAPSPGTTPTPPPAPSRPALPASPVARAPEHASPLVPTVGQQAGTACPRHAGYAVRWMCAGCQAALCSECGATAFQGRVYCATCIHAVTPAPVAAVAHKPQRSGETFETKIGRYWLNRLGITILVLGMAFFIVYTFQYLGPVIKIALGLLASAGLIGAGVWMERQRALRWFARGLIGGGWALLYFTTFAMYHIPEVRVLPSAGVDLFLLLAVASGAVAHSLRYRSEVITVLALLLGFLTTSISQVTTFTLLSSVLLVTALVWIVVRMRWDRLLLSGTAASYVSHFLWIRPQILHSQIVVPGAGSVAQAAFWLNAGFLALYWVAYNVALLSLDEQRDDRRQRLVTATLLNAACFSYAILTGMARVYPDWRHLVALAVGVGYVCSDWIGPRKRLPTLTSVHALIGLSLLTLAGWLQLSGRWFSVWWLSELALILWIGLRYARWPYRLFAFALMVIILMRLLTLDLWVASPITVLGHLVPWRVLVGLVGAATFGLAAAWHWRPAFKDVLRPIEAHAGHVYFTAGMTLVWLLTLSEIRAAWVSAAWTLEAAGTVLLGFWLKDHVVRAIGAMGFATAGVRLMGEVGSWDPWAALVVIGAAYAMSWCYRLASNPPRDESALGVQALYAIGALLVVTELLRAQVAGPWLSLAWLIEVVALVGLGFLLGDGTFRLFAIWLTIIVAAPLLCVEHSHISRAAYPPVMLLGLRIPWRVFTGSIGVVGFGVTAAWYRRARSGQTLRPIEAQAFHVYAFAAAALLWMLIAHEMPADWVNATWAMESAVLVLLGFRLADRPLRFSGAVGSGVTLLHLLGWVGHWPLWPTGAVAAALYAMSAGYRRLPAGEAAGLEAWCRHGYAIAASTVLTVLLWNEVQREWVSVALALEGAALVGAGFRWPDKVFRLSGLSVFALLVVKILFVDLAGAETIYRILSFIVAGAMLLGASFAYAKFSTRGSKGPP